MNKRLCYCATGTLHLFSEPRDFYFSVEIMHWSQICDWCVPLWTIRSYYGIQLFLTSILYTQLVWIETTVPWAFTSSVVIIATVTRSAIWYLRIPGIGRYNDLTWKPPAIRRPPCNHPKFTAWIIIILKFRYIGITRHGATPVTVLRLYAF